MGRTRRCVEGSGRRLVLPQEGTERFCCDHTGGKVTVPRERPPIRRLRYNGRVLQALKHNTQQSLMGCGSWQLLHNFAVSRREVCACHLHMFSL